jgi:hypothetical protein
MMGDAPPYPFVAASHPHTTAVSQRYVRRWDPEIAPAVIRGAAASDGPRLPELAAMDIPALILTWPGDRGHPESTARRLHGALRGSELHIAADPADLATWPTRVQAFLATLPPASDD